MIALPGSSFALWRRVVDFYLLAQTGRVVADTPVPERLLRAAWGRGWKAYDVATALALPAASVPRATLSRFYADRRPTSERERVLARIGG